MRDRTPKMLTFNDLGYRSRQLTTDPEAPGCPWNNILYPESFNSSIPFTYLYGFLSKAVSFWNGPLRIVSFPEPERPQQEGEEPAVDCHPEDRALCGPKDPCSRSP